ncbi:MAG: ATPase RavA [Lentisphaerae bacterium ADurb.Bin242]|nr:MAG: ATPase RavA [Lentisphaerae bacterium ADurb.Bin242]
MEEMVQTLKRLPSKMEELKQELSRRIFGQEELIETMLAAIVARGHCLLTGVPGLAKTLLVSSLGETAELSFKRIQFTPDMMPSDITGSEILDFRQDGGTRAFQFMRGPVFANLVLADEINRTPPKTQSALLEAMQERVVTVAGKRYELEEPFFVLATQNPIEQEGTYPLPEAQLDRFMFALTVKYPKFDDEVRVMLETTNESCVTLNKVISKEELLAFQNAVRAIPLPRSVAELAAKIVRATRPEEQEVAEKYIRWGAGPRACQCLALAGKVFAAFDGRFNVADGDILRALLPVMRHRVILNYRAEAEKVTLENILGAIVKAFRK